MMVSFMQIQSNKQKQMMEEMEKQQDVFRQQQNKDSITEQSHDNISNSNNVKKDHV